MKTWTAAILLGLAACFPAGQPASASPGEPLPNKQGEGSPSDEMRRANRLASALLEARLRRDRPADHAILLRCGPRIIVVRGRYDHAGDVLRAVGVPHTPVDPDALDRMHLSPRQVVIVNCPGALSEVAVRRLGEFVRGGGYLFTTDWSLFHVLEKAFPGYVRWNRVRTRDDVVGITVRRGGHPFLDYVAFDFCSPRWWLENQSYPIEVLDRRAVEVLIESPDMERRYGEEAIAVTFRPGRGCVLHIASHYYLQRCDTRGPRDPLPAQELARAAMGFGPEEFAEIEEKCDGAGVRAVDLASAHSVGQLLVNFILAQVRDEGPEPPPEPEPPPRPRPEPRPADGDWRLAARDCMLRDRPSRDAGEIKLVHERLRVRLLETRGDWCRIATPAGDTGWVPRGALEEGGN